MRFLCRLVSNETVQYFQFDSDGNMYMYAPGAGCTGNTKLVKPGDELIFNSTYNAADWGSHEEETIAEKVETNLASTCPVTSDSTSRRSFKEP